MNKKEIMKNSIMYVFTALVVAGFAVAGMGTVYADCEETYGGGENCVYNKRFEIEKKVRIKGDDSWKDKVTGVEKNDTIEFKIKIKNRSDEGTPVNFDNMKMSDNLPDELIKVGGDGLTEYFDSFGPGESKTFIIRAKVDPDEFDTNKDFEKCVVNKAEVKWNKKFEGADTATVCYEKNAKPKELPRTGAESIPAMAGGLMTLVGLVIKRRLTI